MLPARWGPERNGPVAGGGTTSGFGALAVHASTVHDEGYPVPALRFWTVEVFFATRAQHVYP